MEPGRPVELWNVWTDKASGEMVESYTMILGAATVTQWGARSRFASGP